MGSEAAAAEDNPAGSVAARALVRAFRAARAAQATGAQFLFNRSVVEIPRTQGRVAGVVLDDGRRIEAPVVEALLARGHEINLINPFSMSCGGMQAISRDQQTGALNGAADSRRDGGAIAL